MSQQLVNGSHYKGSVTITNRQSDRYAVVNPPEQGKHRKTKEQRGTPSLGQPDKPGIKGGITMISVYTKDYIDNDILIVIKALTDIDSTAAKYNLPAPSHSLYADADRATHYLARKLSEHCENINKGDIVK